MTLNLVAFDDVLIRNKNWISPTYKKFYSKTLPKMKYFTILKRYDPEKSETNFYLLLSNVITPDKVWRGIIHNPGYDKFDIKEYWNELGIKGNKDIEINITLEEGDDDMLLYYMDI